MPAAHFSTDLDKNEANHSPLSPLTFIERAAAVYPDHCALVYDDVRRNWRDTYHRCRQFASALQRHGIENEDTVALMLPNVPAMYEAHFAIPMAGAVIHAINIRLDAEAIAFQLQHGGARVLLTDPEFSEAVASALGQLDEKLLVIDVNDPAVEAPSSSVTSSTRIFWLPVTPSSSGGCRQTNGRRSRSATPPARQVTQKAL